MREFLQLLVAHHVPWIIGIGLLIVFWQQISRWWGGGPEKTVRPKSVEELQAELQELERKRAELEGELRKDEGKKMASPGNIGP